MMSKNSYQRNDSIFAEPGSVVNVRNSATRKNVPKAVRIQRDFFFLPMNKVGARRMTPVHRTPHRTVRIILEKQMIDSLIVKHTVRVIHPVPFWSEMNLRAML